MRFEHVVDRTLTQAQQDRFSRFCLICHLMHKKAQKVGRKVNAEEVLRTYTIYSYGKTMNALGQMKKHEGRKAS